MFDFNGNYIIGNESVELRPLEMKDIDRLYSESNDKNIWEYFTEDGFGRENFEKYIKSALQKRKDRKEYSLVIKDMRVNAYAGMTRIYDIDNGLKNVKIGHTWIGKKFQGTGLNKNCKYVLFEFLFDKLGMERIGFGASSENIVSIKAMESVGCIQEGVLRSFLPSKNSKKRVDIVLLSILKEEWELTKKEALNQKINR